MLCLIPIVLVVAVISVGLYFNQADWGGKRVNWIDGWVRVLCRVWHRQNSATIDLPATGAAIVAANHVSGLDPFLLITASKRPLRFLIAQEEYQRPILNWLFQAAGCIPVDRKGRPEKALRAAQNALERGEVLAIFPHGKIHLDTDPPKPMKAGVLRLAEWTACDIYPVRIDGVSAQGSVLMAPFIPSHVRLSVSPQLSITAEGREAVNETLKAYIETPTDG